MCPGDSARRAGWQASPGGRGLLMGAIPSERVLDERGPRRTGTCTRPPARGPWRVAPGARIPACDPDTRTSACAPPRRAAPGTRTLVAAPGVRVLACEPWHTAPDVRTRFASCAHAAVALPERRMLGNLREGSYWSTSANGAGRPRVPHPCEPACVRGRSPGKMLRRCAPKRSAMAICRLDAFLSVQPWQYIVLMHSRAFNYGSKLPWCIPERATDGKNAS